MSLSPQNPTRFMHLVDQTIDRFCRMPAHRDPQYSLKITLERSNFLEDIKKSEIELEKMRVREIERRSRLVSCLQTVKWEAERAEFKVSMRVWDEASEFHDAYQRTKEADAALAEIISDIQLAELEIRDAQRTLDDPACWTEQEFEHRRAAR